MPIASERGSHGQVPVRPHGGVTLQQTPVNWLLRLVAFESVTSGLEIRSKFGSLEYLDTAQSATRSAGAVGMIQNRTPLVVEACQGML